jgi:hypothetical protein
MATPATDGNDAEREMKRISRRSFLWAGAATLADLAVCVGSTRAV